MKTIYSSILARLQDKVPALRWIDWDTAQLDVQTDRPSVKLPCALISIGINRAKDITETIQDCEAQVTVRLAFDRMERTNSEAAPEVREEKMLPYDVISDVYAALQGFETQSFHALSRTSQAKENNRLGLFVYRISFKTDFEDDTAEEQ